MKTLLKILKWTGILLISAVVIFSIVVASRQNKKWDAPFPDIKASTDSAVIAHGEYLFYGPAHCMECHTDLDGYARVVKGERLPPSGGLEFMLPIGIERTPNITSDMETGIGKLTDAQIARSLRYGVGSDGRVMLDFMPFHNTSDADLQAIISYLRTIPPVKKEVPPREFNMLGKVINAFVLKPVGPDGEVKKSVEPGETLAYGEYLANSIANCKGCHTNRDLMTGGYIGEFYAGGFAMEVPGKPGTFCVSRNLTPDPKTGHIVSWTQEQFVERFRKGKIIAESPMPWGPFQNFSDSDLKAIFMYIKTLEPVEHDAGQVLLVKK